uniref:Ig-like domain-containing protein n=1 Tax=Gopherus evgoodei TaxID=1825980 RepID=A0A8C4W2S1_9SAUR
MSCGAGPAPQGRAGGKTLERQMEGSYPKPSISVSPSGVIPVGGTVTIRCWHQLLDMRILLYKDEDENYLNYTDPVGSEAEFPITSARWEHGGSYTCRYSNRTGEVAYSEPSDPVQIIVAGREYPKPTIWVSPSTVVALGGNVTIRCEGRYLGMEFVLRKDGHPNLQVWMVPARKVAEFPIPSVGQEDGGSYTCDYRSIRDQNRSSHPSDPVEITVGEPSYPKPSISASPGKEVSLGTAVSIRCRGQHPGVRFVLNKEGRHFPPVDSDGLEAEFSTSNVHRDLGGSYTCSYHSRSEPFAVSYPSDPMDLPRPSISLSPTAVTAPGADLTIRCQGQRRDVRFFLHKAVDLNPQQHMDRTGAAAEFRIPTVGRQHGGSYSCSYRPRSEPFISSQPSDTVQLVVAGEGPSSVSPLPAATSEVQHLMRCCYSDPAEGMPGWEAGTESLGDSPARGEQQPLETRGREATLTLPFVHRNRESLFNPLIPSALFSRPRPRQCPEAGAAGEAVAWWTRRWAGTSEIWPSSWRGNRLCVMGAHRGFKKCPSWGTGGEGLNLGGSQAERPQTKMPTESGDLCKCSLNSAA